jgi:peptidyl-prolyl cis-trans isomerase A (cyclophilin A)
MRKNIFLIASFAFAVLFAACHEQAKSPAPKPQAVAVSTPAMNPPSSNNALLNPALAVLQAPSVYDVVFATTKGNFTLKIHRAWAPNAADRFYNLVKIGYYNNCSFFRVVKGFMVQFGINGDPAINAKWFTAKIPDDISTGHSNARGTISFATAGPNTRTTQVFVNYANNTFLDPMGFSPFGQVSQGMNVVDALFSDYGDGPPSGPGPDQNQLQQQGNVYLQTDFPHLDYITTATIQP